MPFIPLLRLLCSSSSQARGKPRVKLLPARLALSFFFDFFGLLFFPFLFLLRQLCSSSQARGKPRVKLLPARLALSLYSSKLLPISAALAFELYPMASECLRYWNYQSLIYETSSNRSYMYTMCLI